ncbi:MAG TPA: family 16 glycoside hydrolase, partial [Salinimicrobium sp.]|nr:family 16 glycoside hydrolase [Salinimicrobium sp.]
MNKNSKRESMEFSKIQLMKKIFIALAFSVFLHEEVFAQKEIKLNDLSSFKNPSKSWAIVGGVYADLEKENSLETKEGQGVLVNAPSKKSPGKDLITNFEHGNIDLELDFLMAKGSNSGIYLQGMYEIQLFDGWGNPLSNHGSNGGVYQRWDESKPEGQKGYQGYAPRQKVGRAPGLWQHLKVSFQAPIFNAAGEKIENAKILKAELNGVLIHEDLPLFGPTRGSLSSKETAMGPLRFQGDHGAVAFRNIKITAYDNPKPELKNLEFAIYDGKFEKEPVFDSLPPEAEGTSVILTSNLKNRPQNFLIRYSGTLDVKVAGEYNFDLQTVGGTGVLKIDEKVVIPLYQGNNGGTGTIELPAGELPFELLYSKFVEWDDPALGLSISGPGIREYLISDAEEMLESVSVDPILVSASEIPVLRSFMDVPNAPRITHAVSVGSENGLHYTYDLNHGALVQLWRGGFLDATPMWHSRGDGSSRPQGSVQYLIKQPELAIAKLKSAQDAWVTDTLGSSFRPKGYILDNNRKPVFQYRIYGAAIEDAINVLEGGKGIERKIKLDNQKEGLYMRLAEGSKIEELEKGMYLVGEKDYYIKINENGGEQPLVRNSKNGQE